jgi:hypothetical protein
VRELKRDPTSKQQRHIDRRSRQLAQKLGADKDDLSWIQWSKKSRFGRECRAGDTIFSDLQLEKRKGASGDATNPRAA